MNPSSHAEPTHAEPERFIRTMRMQCSNRLFFIPFAAKHALQRLRDHLVHHETEHQRTFWTREAFYIDAELRVLNNVWRRRHENVNVWRRRHENVNVWRRRHENVNV